ncbi:MAG: preprotein translocase subunit SecE [Acidimicrobiales bacterium]
MNRETKRLLQRQGQLGPDGEPIAPDREERVQAAAAGRRGGGAGGAAGGRGAGGRGAGGRGAGGRSAGAGGVVEKEALPKRIAQFLREVRSELARVAWPSRSEVVNYTIVVFFAVAFLTLIVYGLDAGFLTVVNYLFKK